MIKILFGILSVLLAFSSCENNEIIIEQNVNNIGQGIVGSWYTEDIALEMFAERTFTPSGEVYVDEYRKMYGYKRVEEYGKYTLEGQSLTTNLQSSIGTTSYSYIITKLTDLSFETSSIDYGKATYNRIVGTITFQKSEEQEIDVLQFVQAYTNKDIAILSSQIDDKAIASFVDGKFAGKLIGQTYLKVDTSIGRVIIKLSVEDKNNLLNDYSIVLGKQIDDVENILGKHYAYKNDSVLQYIYNNYYVNTVKVYRHSNNSVIDSVVIECNKTMSPETIVEEYKRNLIQVENCPEDYIWFTNSKNFLLSKYSARYYYRNNSMVYTRINPDWDDRTYDLGLSADELRNKYGQPGDFENNTMIFDLNEDFITRIAYHFSNGIVSSYRIHINFQKVTKEMVENYLGFKFRYLDPSHPYVKNYVVNGDEKILYAKFDSNTYEIFYQVVNNRY